MRNRFGGQKDGASDAGSAELSFSMQSYTWRLPPFERVPDFAP